MRGSAMGFLNEEPVITPTLDEFSSQSLVLPNAISNYPVCSPYRGMFMTGKYPFANSVISNCTDATEPYGVELQQADLCWSDILKNRGYSLGYIGKWHLESPREPFIECRNNIEDDVRWNEWTPPHRRHGFDYWYAYNTYDYHMRPMYWSSKAGRTDFHYVDQWSPEHEADKSVAFINNENGEFREPDKPFTLVVSMNPPHMPYYFVPEKYVARYNHLSVHDLTQRPNIPPQGTWAGYYYRNNIRNYYAMITGVDEQFGRILQALDDQNLADNTIVVFTSDHGDCLGIHDKISKGNPYEESLKVPFMIRWPDQIPPRTDELILSVPDIYPTLLELMGFGKDIPNTIEGTSYSRLFKGAYMERPSSGLYFNIPYKNPNLGERGIRTKRYTYVKFRHERGEVEEWLFDNEKDPYQLHNLTNDNEDLKKILEDLLVNQLNELQDPWIKT